MLASRAPVNAVSSDASLSAHDLTDVYIDETAQSGPRYLVLGGLVFPTKYSAEFERAILDARGKSIPTHHQDGTLFEVGWNAFNPSRRELEAYKNLVDVAFSFGRRFKSTRENIRFHASVVDTTVRNRRYAGKRGQVGFNREIYYHCLRLGRHDNYLHCVFNVYPDDRTTSQPTQILHGILCMGLRKHRPNDPRYLPYRTVQFRLSHQWQAIQISDILIGAMQYRLNGLMENSNSNEFKKELCEYILKKGQAWAHCAPNRPKSKDWGNFRIWFRKQGP